MVLRPSEQLSEKQVENGLKLCVADGLMAEAMATFTSGTFLVAIALYLGASDFQIGLLAALPALTNVFQILAIGLVQRYNNRRAIAVFAHIIARTPLLLIGMLPFLFSAGTSLQVLIFLLFFHFFFASVAGPSWNSWIKDLVPEQRLGAYFSQRSRKIQILNVTLSLLIALSLDYIKDNYPQYEMIAYSAMFVTGGMLGLLGVYIMSRVPERKAKQVEGNILQLFAKPLKDNNFRKLLLFNSFWAFSINLATPFFTAYMLTTLGLPLSYIIALGIIGQVCSILVIKSWGRYADKFSNKTIISIAGPLYILCIIAWIFTATTYSLWITLTLLAFIHIFSGIATAGINLAVNNIGLKLASKDESIVYLAARSMVVAFFSAMAPLIGGLLSDFFATHGFSWSFSWEGPAGVKEFTVVELKHWRFLFLIGGILAAISLRFLSWVKETGEVDRDLAVAEMRSYLRDNVIEKISNPSIRVIYDPSTFAALMRKRRMERRLNKVRRE